MEFLDLYVNVAITHFTRKNFGAFALAPAGSILQADVPTVPAADHFARLHDAFTQRKSEMRTKILDGINGVVPAKERQIETRNLDRVAEPFAGKLRQAGSAHPFFAHGLMLYLRRRRMI